MSKIKLLIKKVKSLFINVKGLFISLWYFKGNPSKSRIFYGYWHWSLAKRYANKRNNWWPPKYNQNGKMQGIFTYSDESLIVISPMEIKLLKKRKYIKNPKWYRKIFNKHNLYKVA